MKLPRKITSSKQLFGVMPADSDYNFFKKEKNRDKDEFQQKKIRSLYGKRITLGLNRNNPEFSLRQHSFKESRRNKDDTE